MKKYVSLTKRNCLVFLRDKGAVFFSLLSMLIVLMLMGVFLGNMNEENVLSLLKEYGGVRDALADEENAKHLVQYWTLAGILVVNAVMVTLTVIGIRVDDVTGNRLTSFYSAPVKRSVLALSYITAAVLVGSLSCGGTLGIASIYIAATGGALLSGTAVGSLIMLILLIVSIFAVIMYLLSLFVKSSGAWSGIGTVVGTLVGFAGAIYLPMGNLPEGVANVLKYLPVLHGAAMLREVCCKDILADTFVNVPMEVVSKYKEYVGMTIYLDEKQVSFSSQLLFLVLCGIIAFGIVVVVQRRKDVSDR